MSHRKFGPEEIDEFLHLLDSELTRPVTVTLIGGAAIGLLYDPKHATTDVDFLPVIDAEFWGAVERARGRMAERLPVQCAGVYSAPYEYEDRRRSLELAQARFLTVLVPEQHDLALMKVARGLGHDLEALEDVHARTPFDLETLIERYYDTRTQVIGPEVALTLSFLSLVDRLFGAELATKVEERLERCTPPPVKSV